MADRVEVETGSGEARGSVIWLHGLGADGHDFEPIVPELDLGPDWPLRFVFPHAPVRPVTINGGMAMRAWYDIISLEPGGAVDEDGIRDSRRILEDLVSRERERGIPGERIVVAGFSQGGAIAIDMALRSRASLAGLMALSTYLALPDAAAAWPGPDRQRLPVFMAHGRLDPVLPLALGQASREAIERAGYTVEWHEYRMAHGVCPEEVADIRNWLRSVFASAD